MKFKTCLLIFFLLLLTIRIDNLTARDKQKEWKGYKEGELLVKFKKGTWWVTKSATHKLYKAKVKKKLESVDIEQIELEEGMTVEKALALYKNDPDVEYAEPNYKVKKAVVPFVPNDSFYNRQWHHNNIESEKAWGKAIEKMESSPTSSIIVAILDTGVDYNHPELKDHIWKNEAENCTDNLDNDNNGFKDDCVGWNFVKNNNDPMDDDIAGAGSHGTHVAGIVSALGNNGFGVIGVAGITANIKIMPVKILDEYGDGYVSDVIEGIQYAKKMGAKIINLSLEADESVSQINSLDDAIKDAPDKLFVVAAGNGSEDLNSENIYPASFNRNNIVSVAATDNDDKKTNYSNYGANIVHLGVPGNNIYSTRSKKTMVLKGIFQNYSSAFFYETGTSMATPMVTGTASLIWSINPNYSYKMVKEIILSTVDKKNLPVITKGRLNVFRAISSDIISIPPAPPSRLKLENINGAIKISWQDESETESHYKIERQLNNNFEVIAQNLPQNSSSYQDNLAVNEGDIITYRVYAVNSNGEKYNDITQKVPLATPTNLRAVKVSNGVYLSWQDNTAKETKYVIERRDQYNSYQIIKEVSENTTEYLDTDVSSGIYYYRVRAYNNDNSSAYSEEVVINTTAKSNKSGCYIATYLFGEYHPYTEALRSFRDEYLLNNFFGRQIVALYYIASPPLVAFANNRPFIKTGLKCIAVPVAYLIFYPIKSLLLICIIFLIYGSKKNKKVKQYTC